MGIPPMSGSVDTMSSMGNMAMSAMPTDSPLSGAQEEPEEPDGYTEEELQLTKKFIDMIGGPERARELVDKVNECEDCLDIIDDGDTEEEDDAASISVISRSVPDAPDLPRLMAKSFDPGQH